MNHRPIGFALFALVALLGGTSGAAVAGNGHMLHGFGPVNSAMGGAGSGLSVDDPVGALMFNPALMSQAPHSILFTCSVLAANPEDTVLDLSNLRFLLEGTLRDADTFTQIATVRDKARTNADGWARFKPLAIELSPLPRAVLFLPRIKLQDAGPLPWVQWQCVISEAEPPCVPGANAACLLKRRFEVRARRNGVPLKVSRAGDGFAFFNDQMEVQVFSQCGDPETRGYTVQVDNLLNGVDVEVTDALTGASGHFFPSIKERLLAFAAFPTCP